MKAEIGMKASLRIWSDVEPYTIVEVSKSGKSVKARRENYRIISGTAYDGSAVYECFEQPDGHVSEFTLRKNGRWKAKGVPMNQQGMTLSLGSWRRYYDPSF